MIWFSADYHFSHKNIIKYCNRPFSDVDDMDNTIMINLKNAIKSGDTLYYLGDLTFDKYIAEDFFQNFRHIKIHYISGNHDSKKVLTIASEYCVSMSEIKDIKVEGTPITLCHYAMRVWNKSHFNAWQLYGHSHGTLEPVGKQYDIGVDTNDFKPISYDYLLELMNAKPDNFNYIPPENRDR